MGFLGLSKNKNQMCVRLVVDGTANPICVDEMRGCEYDARLCGRLKNDKNRMRARKGE